MNKKNRKKVKELIATKTKEMNKINKLIRNITIYKLAISS